MTERLILRPWWFWSPVLGFMAFIGLCAVTDIDLALSAQFYVPEAGWHYADAWGWRWLFDYGLRPAIVMASGALVVWIGSWLFRAWKPYRRASLVLVLVVALGPGLVVNSILKPYWGRPRPRHVMTFGGGSGVSPLVAARWSWQW